MDTKNSISVQELEMLLQHILKNAQINEHRDYYGQPEGFIISDINSSSNGKEEYKLFIEKIVGAMDSLAD